MTPRSFRSPATFDLAGQRSMMRKAITRSGSSPISKYSPPPATASCTNELRSSTERMTGGGRVPSGRAGSGIMPPVVVPMPATCTGILCARASWTAEATVPLQAWPSEMTRKPSGSALAEHLFVLVHETECPSEALFDVGVPRGRVLGRNGERSPGCR